MHYNYGSWLPDSLEGGERSDGIHHSITSISSHCSLCLGLALLVISKNVAKLRNLLRLGSIPKRVYELRRGSEQDTASVRRS